MGAHGSHHLEHLQGSAQQGHLCSPHFRGGVSFTSLAWLTAGWGALLWLELAAVKGWCAVSGPWCGTEAQGLSQAGRVSA